MRKAISKLRLSAHNLLIETGRYAKPRSLPRSERICKHCNFNLKKMSCTFFHGAPFMKQKGQNCTIKYTKKTILSCRCVITTKPGGLILLQEERDILFALGTYIHSCFEKRHKKCVTN